jgi:protein O-GlcNAc transferase
MPYEQCQAVVVRGQSGSHRRQLSWVRGNVGGGEPFDYIIADPIVLPDQTSQFFDERSFVCPAASCRVVITSERSTMLRPIGPITISGRNGLCFAGSIMSTRSSRLGLLDEDLEERGAVGLVAVRCGRYRKSNLRKEAKGRGVDPDRLVFARRVASSPEHLARHRIADLCLDTLPTPHIRRPAMRCGLVCRW